MGTLAEELATHAGLPDGPRIYADANVPAGVVAFMRQRLHWDVLYVIEHDDLRHALVAELTAEAKAAREEKAGQA